MNDTKKLFLITTVVGSFLIYSYNKNLLDNKTVQTTVLNLTNELETAVTNPPVSVLPTTAIATKPIYMYRDGTFVGSVADAYYGNIQVQIKINNGKISDLKFLQYPNDRSTSREINSFAMPQLKREALKTQSYKVDIISGATDSSQAFIQSLRSALLSARN